MSRFVVRPLMRLPEGPEEETEHRGDGVRINNLFNDCVHQQQLARQRAREMESKSSLTSEVDRATRRTTLQERLLPGILCEDLLAHARCTEDEYERMLERNRFHHVSLADCITQDQENMLGDRRTNQRVTAEINAQGLWQQVKEDILPKADFPDIHHLQCAMRRRAMAADVMGVCPYEAYDTVQIWLMRKKLARPRAPWVGPSWADLYEADQFVSTEVIRHTPSGIRPDAHGSPMARAIPLILQNSELHQIMMPKQVSTRAVADASAAPSAPLANPPSGTRLGSAPAQAGKKRKRKSPSQRLKEYKADAERNQARKGKGKDKGRDRPAGKGGKAASKGATGKAGGKGKCRFFQTGTCHDTECRPGGTCNKGYLHLCDKCNGPHQANDCQKP